MKIHLVSLECYRVEKHYQLKRCLFWIIYRGILGLQTISLVLVHFVSKIVGELTKGLLILIKLRSRMLLIFNFFFIIIY